MHKLVPVFVAAFMLALLVMPAIAQEASVDGRITGHVVAGAAGEPLQGATIEIRRSDDSTFVTGAVTGEDGAFEIADLPAGAYDARLSFVGFTTRHLAEIRIDHTHRDHDLGVIEIEEGRAQLADVEVAAERAPMETRLDRTVYNVGDHPTSAGGSAHDVLRDLPSIDVDTEGTISYRGNQNVAIHIDGRPSALTGDALVSFLQSLSADAIERVEMIPTPSARYEPDGMAGIINIVLARQRGTGWSGGLAAGIGTSTSHHGSAHIGYQAGPWTAFANYGYRHNTHDLTMLRLREHRSHNPASKLEQSSAEDHLHLSHSLNTQFEYRLGTGSTLSLASVLSMRSNDTKNRTDVTQGLLDGNTLERQVRLESNQSTPRRIDARLSLYHAFEGDDTHALEAQLRYQHNDQNRDGSYRLHSATSTDEPGELLEEEVDLLSQYTRRGVLEVDYDRPLGALELEAGYQASLRRIETDRGLTVLTAHDHSSPKAQSFTFAHDEQIHAGYSTVSLERDRVGVKVGLRAEQALTDFTQAMTEERYTNDYLSFFPSAFLTYSLSEAHQVQLSYSKRINRPNMWQLNPVNRSSDPTYRIVGNPHLDPEYTHAFELGLTRHWNALTLRASPFFRHTVNRIQAYEEMDEDGVSTVTFDNFATSNSYGAELVGTIQLNNRLQGNVSVNAYRMVTDASNVDGMLSNDALAVSSRANLTFHLRPGLRLQWTQIYRSPMEIPGGRVGHHLVSHLTLRQDILEGRGNIRLRASDVFDAMGHSLWRTSATFYQETHRSMNARQLMLTFQYTFGRPNQQDRMQNTDGDMDSTAPH